MIFFSYIQMNGFDTTGSLMQQQERLKTKKHPDDYAVM